MLRSTGLLKNLTMQLQIVALQSIAILQHLQFATRSKAGPGNTNINALKCMAPQN